MHSRERWQPAAENRWQGGVYMRSPIPSTYPTSDGTWSTNHQGFRGRPRCGRQAVQDSLATADHRPPKISSAPRWSPLRPRHQDTHRNPTHRQQRPLRVSQCEPAIVAPLPANSDTSHRRPHGHPYRESQSRRSTTGLQVKAGLRRSTYRRLAGTSPMEAHCVRAWARPVTPGRTVPVLSGV